MRLDSDLLDAIEAAVEGRVRITNSNGHGTLHAVLWWRLAGIQGALLAENKFRAWTGLAAWSM